MISGEKLHILRHSLGYDDEGKGTEYRNYYASGKDCDGYDLLLELVEEGLMVNRGFCDPRFSAGLEYFEVTQIGKRIVNMLKPMRKKRTAGQERYRAFLKFDGSMSFIEFCRFYDAENKKRNF